VSKGYTEFVRAVMGCIWTLMPEEKNKPACFAEAGEKNGGSCQEYAVLRFGRTEFFTALIRENAEALGVDAAAFWPEYRSTAIKADGTALRSGRYSHSVYPKNLRRWLRGTVSRKRKCRVEWTALVAAWAAGWEDPMKRDADYAACREALAALCGNCLEKEVAVPESPGELLVLLWQTGQCIYAGSRKTVCP